MKKRAPKKNARQPHRRVRKALKKYAKQQLGLPTQYTPAQVRVDSKGEIDIKFSRPPKGQTRNPKRFSVSARGRNPEKAFNVQFRSGSSWRHAETVYASSAKEALRHFKSNASSHAYDGTKLRVRAA